MARVTETSREAYYEHVLSGKAATQTERIMRFVIFEAKAGRTVTRSIIDRFFDPRAQFQAKDGGPLIAKSSSTARVHAVVCHQDNCDHALCRHYLQVDHRAPDPYSGEPVEWLKPIGDQWNQRRMF